MNVIYGRNANVQKINNEEGQLFLEENHRQGASYESIKKESIGIFDKKENLIGIAQFCSPRTSAKKKKYSTELLRLCFKKDYRVIGGASKLIKYYILHYNPSDIFTYQDTTGENSAVYEKCGFSLVEQDKEKKYLIINGKNLKNADRRSKEIFSLSYVVSRGPDALLGTKLGTVYDENQKRKTNVELFTELGWHVETTTGDKVYEWFNPNLSFYTYKITSTNSNKYYYGVSSIKKPYSEVSMKDCLSDGYYGSGGNTVKNNKFCNWKKKHKETIKKEVLEIFERKYLAYESEKNLIGDLWKTDKLCLNSTYGGNYTGFNKGWRENIFIKTCEIHGDVKHRGNACYKCFMNELVSERVCEIHGLTKFQGDSCSKCAVAKTFTEKICEEHGMTVFSGSKCRKCSVNNTVKMKVCKIHGETKHQGDVCNKCNASSVISFKICEIHGETKFIGSKCRKCISSKNTTMKNCYYHGLSSHRGDKCMKCSAQKGKHNKGIHKDKPDSLCFLCSHEEDAEK